MHDLDRSLSPPASSQAHIPMHPSASPSQTPPAVTKRRGRRAAPYPSPDAPNRTNPNTFDASAEAGPSRLSARTTSRVPRAIHTTKAARSAVVQPIDVDDDDEPVFVGQSIARKLSEKYAFKGAASSPGTSGDEVPGSRISSRSTTTRGKVAGTSRMTGTLEKDMGKGKGKERATPGHGQEEALLLPSSDEVEMVGVVEKRRRGRPKKSASAINGAKRATSKAKRSARAGAKARAASVASTLGSEGSPPPAPPPLQLMPFREPLPVPAWLGKPAVLLPLKTCPICMKKWAKSDAGVKRWVSRISMIPVALDPPSD